MTKKLETTSEKRKITQVSKAVSKRIMEIDHEVVLTSDYIANQYGKGLLDADDMADILCIKRNSVLQKINQNTLPFKVTKVGDQWYTTPFNVAKYIIQNQQNRGMLAAG